MDKIKTLKDFEFEQITDVKPDGYKNNAPGRKRIIKRKCVFSYHLKQEGIKIIKRMELNDDCSGHGVWLNGDTYTEDMKELLTYFLNIKEEDLND